MDMKLYNGNFCNTQLMQNFSVSWVCNFKNIFFKKIKVINYSDIQLYFISCCLYNNVVSKIEPSVDIEAKLITQ